MQVTMACLQICFGMRFKISQRGTLCLWRTLCLETELRYSKLLHCILEIICYVSNWLVRNICVGILVCSVSQEKYLQWYQAVPEPPYATRRSGRQDLVRIVRGSNRPSLELPHQQLPSRTMPLLDGEYCNDEEELTWFFARSRPVENARFWVSLPLDGLPEPVTATPTWELQIVTATSRPRTNLRKETVDNINW